MPVSNVSKALNLTQNKLQVKSVKLNYSPEGMNEITFKTKKFRADHIKFFKR